VNWEYPYAAEEKFLFWRVSMFVNDFKQAAEGLPLKAIGTLVVGSNLFMMIR